jgi:hypothetical protein
MRTGTLFMVFDQFLVWYLHHCGTPLWYTIVVTTPLCVTTTLEA